MNILSFLVLFVISSASVGQAANIPTLNFTDLVSGPSTGLNDGVGEGTIVTVWGNNLGATQGSSKLTIGGIAPSHIYYWKNADGVLPSGPADLYTYQKMQEIAFSLPASLTNGQYEIQVTVDSQASNTLPFTVRDGRILHIKTTGSAGGNGSWSSPWSKLFDGISKYKAGDIVYSHNGVSDVNTYGDPSGTTGTGILFSGIKGTLDKQVAFVGYPGSRTLIKGASNGIDIYLSDAIVISKQTVRVGKWATPATDSTTILPKDSGEGIKGSANGRVIANDVSQTDGKCVSGYAGAIWTSSAYGVYDYISNSIYYGNYVHDWGCKQTSKFEHTTYMSIRNNDAAKRGPFNFAWNILKNNAAKYGIHIYDENWNNSNCGDFTGIVTIHDNYVINQRSAGIDLASGANNGYICWTNPFSIYNNVLINTGLGPADEAQLEETAIRIGDQGMTSNVKIYNNTIYGIGDNTPGAAFKAAIAFLDNPSLGGKITVDISNNIIYDTSGDKYTSINPTTFPNISGSNNLWFSSGGTLNSTVDSRLTGNIFKNPKFLDLKGDFNLSNSSPAIDAGIDVSASVKNDILGVRRPQGSAFDIGAYEVSTPSIITIQRQ